MIRKNRTLPVVIFTDLDGTLLNHDDYSYRDALPIIAHIREQSIPLIICTSKTRYEVLDFRKELSIYDPFITENGGGIFFQQNQEHKVFNESEYHDGYRLIRLGKYYSEIRAFFMELKKRFAITGFGDMDVSAIQSLTGLSMDQATKAKRREFTEPFIFESEQDIFLVDQMAGQRGFKIVQGGRFYHLISSGQDKSIAVRRVIQIYENMLQSKIISIGAGDSMNDYGMLKVVHYPVLIPHPDGKYEPMDIPNLIKAPFAGSKGWYAAIEKILDTHDKTNCT
ncbi:HAD-IIB family hydrolase [bacterium]|nr:HAD-IIB family hydrolase [bacterium]